jgi:SPP1 gp7 family putative phage head morphogenesis protein
MCQTNQIQQKQITARSNLSQFVGPFDDLILRLLSTKGIRFDKVINQITNRILQQAFSSGRPSFATDLNSTDNFRLSMQEANISRFSASKTVKEIILLNRALSSSTSVEDFRQKANLLNIKYNDSYLKAEYNTAFKVGQTTSDYYDHVRDQDIFPYLMFTTSEDSRVRDEHAKLHGTIVKVGSRQHDLLNPPLGYNCRCRWRQLTNTEAASKMGDLKSHAEIIETLKSSKVGKQDAYKIMQDYGFRSNKAKLNEVFSSAQMYVSNFKETGLAHKDYQLQDFCSREATMHSFWQLRMHNFREP